VNDGEVGDEREKSLEDFQLYVDNLRNEGVEGNGDNFRIFSLSSPHKNGAKEVFCMPAILHDKVRLEIAHRHMEKK